MPDRVNTMPVQNGFAVYVCVISVKDSHQMALFVNIEKIESPNMPLQDARLSRVTLLRFSFCM